MIDEVENKIKEKENAGFKLFKSVMERELQKKHIDRYSISQTPVEQKWNWDATVTLYNGKTCLYELKVRDIEEDKYKDYFFKVSKINALKNIEAESGNKVKCVTFYPKSNSLYIHTLEQITEGNNIKWVKVRKTEMDDDSEEEMQRYFFFDLNKGLRLKINE